MVVLYAKVSDLNLMRAATGNQCKIVRRGVICIGEIISESAETALQ